MSNASQDSEHSDHSLPRNEDFDPISSDSQNNSDHEPESRYADGDHVHVGKGSKTKKSKQPKKSQHKSELSHKKYDGNSR